MGHGPGGKASFLIHESAFAMAARPMYTDMTGEIYAVRGGPFYG